MSARDRILAKLSRTARDLPHPGVAPVPTQGKTSGGDRVDQFIAKIEAASGTAERLASVDDLPQALAAQLRSRNLPARVRTGTDPIFERDWGAVERSVGVGRLEEPATLSRAVAGVAETGTLALVSGPDNPVTLTFLGETHFVVVPEAAVHGAFEELWAQLRESDADPRTVNMVTGPSRSGDIGQTLQLGAHGPVALHVFVVADA